MGFSSIQMVIEDWTFRNQQSGYAGIIHTDEGDFEGSFNIAETVPPNYTIKAFPQSFMYTIFLYQQ